VKTKNFSLGELRCKCGCKMPASVIVRLERLMAQLEVIRAEVKAPVQVISGYRCEKRNRAVGGAKESRHLWGDAVDLQVEGRTGKELREIVEGLIAFGKIPDGGLGTYESRPRTLHYDMRLTPARWHT
jgi:uncharacterized protein YcbK (DUF882 family)